MALWKDQSPSETLLSFRETIQDLSITVEIERCPDYPPYRFTIGNLFHCRSSGRFETLEQCIRAVNELVQCEGKSKAKRVMDKYAADPEPAAQTGG